MVSVICTNYNKGDWIAEAIESFLQQKTNFPVEIILIDDKSTDHSVDIIREYAKKYPDKIHAFYNKKNLGITKTWIKICKEAKGKYIARCDGDDYWTDKNKLQKQVDLLEKSKGSLWCSTDYDIIATDGELIHHRAFKKGIVRRAQSYDEMLITKGFTMSSTWLVDTVLMNEINSEIDDKAIDDTFNIQLELFQKTKLTYLDEATAVYRENDDSDAHPTDVKKMQSRQERLLKTQLEYIDKYKNVDSDDVLKVALERDMQNEMFAVERLQIIHKQWKQMEEQASQIGQLKGELQAIKSSRTFNLATKMQKAASIPRRIIGRIKR